MTSPQDIQAEIRHSIVPIFTTPIANFRWPHMAQLNDELCREILLQEQQSQGIIRSNVGGWHSSTDFFTSDLPCVKALKSRIHGFITEMFSAFDASKEDPAIANLQLEGWANILRHGQYHSLHCHPNAFWSGVYYITGNPPPEHENSFSGKLELVDPRPGASVVYSERTNLYGRFLVNPVPGQMLVFPGWLQHQVHPYFGPGHRMAIAFNAILANTV